MSTQSASSILFTHTTPQQNFRLLELPVELAELLSSDSLPTLELKSPSATSPQATEGLDTADPLEYVNLCTPTQTYRIRQVQSSNSLHIIRPSDGGTQQQCMDINVVGGESQEDVNFVDTMTSIAKCGSTLEMHIPSEGFSAGPFLKTLLGLYDQDRNRDVNAKNMRDEGGEHEEVAQMRNRIIRDVFADVPVSNAQCERGWVETCAFVLLGSGGEEEEITKPKTLCWRPSGSMMLEVWRRLLEGSVLQGIDLGKQFLVRDLWKSVLDDELEAPFPRPLFEAVIRRVCEVGDAPAQIFEFKMKWASIDRIICVGWIGETYLEFVAPTTSSAINQTDFLNAWKDHLPEIWREDVSLSKLTETSYLHPDPKTICFVPEANRQLTKKSVPANSNSATAAKKSRNWHELFNQKRQKR